MRQRNAQRALARMDRIRARCGGDPLRSTRATTQPNRQDTLYWATGSHRCTGGCAAANAAPSGESAGVINRSRHFSTDPAAEELPRANGVSVLNPFSRLSKRGVAAQAAVWRAVGLASGEHHRHLRLERGEAWWLLNSHTIGRAHRNHRGRASDRQQPNVKGALLTNLVPARLCPAAATVSCRDEAQQNVCGAGHPDITKKYYGHDKGVCVVDDYVAHEWAFIPHFYRNFYVFQYATSFTASAALSEKVLSGDPEARNALPDVSVVRRLEVSDRSAEGRRRRHDDRRAAAAHDSEDESRDGRNGQADRTSRSRKRLRLAHQRLRLVLGRPQVPLEEHPGRFHESICSGESTARASRDRRGG